MTLMHADPGLLPIKLVNLQPFDHGKKVKFDVYLSSIGKV